jgi:probable F420-dependent oxidoreductase
VKVRIGIGLGGSGTPGAFAGAVDMLEDMGADSLWLPEMVFGPLVDPVVGMAHALARTQRLKVGTGISVLPGRNPVLVAKQLASLAGLAPGRVLPVFGLQPARPAERPLFPVPAGRRAAVFDESLTLLRLLLRQETVSFAGEFFTVDGAGVGPLPAKPLDIWLGGSAPAALRRVGRLADGWLGSLLTPGEARAGRETIQAAAAAADREVEADHFGISLAVATGPMPAELAASVRQRRPDTDPASLVPAGWDAARRMIGEYVDAGLSKFVIRPATVPPGPPRPAAGTPGAPGAGGAAGLARFLDGFASELMPLQT